MVITCHHLTSLFSQIRGDGQFDYLDCRMIRHKLPVRENPSPFLRRYVLGLTNEAEVHRTIYRRVSRLQVPSNRISAIWADCGGQALHSRNIWGRQTITIQYDGPAFDASQNIQCANCAQLPARPHAFGSVLP
jgi:hypothetical protein